MQKATEAPRTDKTPVFPWTEESVSKLRKLWDEGDSLSVIAGKIGGLNRNQVVSKVHRLGLPGRPSPLGGKSPPVVPSAPVFGVGPAIDALKGKQCKWPIGDPRDSDFRFCDAAHEPGEVYCAAHSRIAYLPHVSKDRRVGRI